MANDILLVENENTFFKMNSKLHLCKTNLQYLQQKIRIVLSFQKGEYFTDGQLGIPYIPEFNMSNAEHKNLLLSYIQNEILKTEGVKQLTRFDNQYDQSRRKMYIDFTVITTDGEEITYKTKFDA